MLHLDRKAVEVAVHARRSAAEQHPVQALGLNVGPDFVHRLRQQGNNLDHSCEIAPLVARLGGQGLHVEASADILQVKIDANFTGHAAYLPFTVCTAFRAAAVPD